MAPRGRSCSADCMLRHGASAAARAAAAFDRLWPARLQQMCTHRNSRKSEYNLDSKIHLEDDMKRNSPLCRRILAKAVHNCLPEQVHEQPVVRRRIDGLIGGRVVPRAGGDCCMHARPPRHGFRI